MTHRYQQNKVGDQLLEVLQQVYEKELEQAHIGLSRPDRVCLYRLVSKTVLADLLARLDPGN